MLADLICHPDTTSEAVTRMLIRITRTRDLIGVNYRILDDPAPLDLPEYSGRARGREDGLWEHTCFELFIRPDGDAGYYELNFSPSGAWAAYRFDGYRSNRTDADPAIHSVRPATSRLGFNLTGRLWLRAHEAATWRVGVAAVIEEKSGFKSYWALAHPPGQPDFHHQDCFALTLPPRVD